MSLERRTARWIIVGSVVFGLALTVYATSYWLFPTSFQLQERLPDGSINPRAWADLLVSYVLALGCFAVAGWVGVQRLRTRRR
ncbi:hypothetical protein KK101_11340 [Curtobacterium flaccumfaciens pv. oortii]|uniref:hypothetical protein n=1 Tax=Curtobacterium flaccumfaciens TaxID=2035 RepID=UPI001BDEE756|nr:hypothetical protein [Curtobacterium flaccumfaciens]MBT1623280.1 hypothetical protein [Curtobacterium flaccumfaciens pv. oortii]